MDTDNCQKEVQERLKETDPGSPSSKRRAVAVQMCRLLDSGKLDADLDNQEVNIDYLISRLDIRDGEDNPTLKEKWNTWVGEMDYLEGGGYNQYQIE